MSKVKIQGNASGTGVVTLTAPNTNTDRTITLPDGDISLGVGIDDNATSTAITIDASENVGIGVVPEATRTSDTVLALGATSTHFVTSSNHDVRQNNARLDASGNPLYITTNPATRYQKLNTGVHTFDVAPSGTADTAISWTTAMTIANGGNVTVNTGNLVIGTSGKGIDFSAATPDGTGSTGSEVLDDYEEGTWTPSSSSNFGTFSQIVGKYTKIGNLVYVKCYFEYTGASTTATKVMGGLPYAPRNDFPSSSVEAQMQYWAADFGRGYISQNSTVVFVTETSLSGTFSAQNSIRMHGWYIT